MQATSGRRERKKAATRHTIAENARRLFLERGYAEVGIRDVASAADVAVTTLFAHFPSKEALVFEHDGAYESRLTGAALDRSPDTSLVAALHRELVAMLKHCSSPEAAPLWAIIDASPDLLAYEERMRARHAASLADAIARGEGLAHPTTACNALARFVLDSFGLARGTENPLRTVAEVFEMIDAAWRARPS